MVANLPSILELAFFGGLASAGFGVLFNCPPRLLPYCFGAGVLSIAVRTIGLENGLGLASASFIAALILAAANRLTQPPQGLRGAFLAVVGCIPMIPGSLAAKGLESLFHFLQASSQDSPTYTIAGLENLITVATTLAAMGTALVIPALIFPGRPQPRRA